MHAHIEEEEEEFICILMLLMLWVIKDTVTGTPVFWSEVELLIAVDDQSEKLDSCCVCWGRLTSDQRHREAAATQVLLAVDDFYWAETDTQDRLVAQSLTS